LCCWTDDDPDNDCPSLSLDCTDYSFVADVVVVAAVVVVEIGGIVVVDAVVASP
jgi:hypothetical protein